jgi:hypothetical protein
MQSTTLLLVAVALLAVAACSNEADTSAAEEAALAADPASADAGGATDAGDGGATVTFGYVKPILDTKCSSCHHAEFTTLDGVKAKKDQMISKISAGKMPKDEPAWRNSADGVLVLNWLQTSPELQ